MRTVLSCMAWLIVLSAAAQSVAPKPLLIYYGFPSKINGVTTNQAAANEFSRYAYVIWPDNIENSQTNPVEAPKTQAILNLISTGTRVHGYVSLSQRIQGPLTQAQIRQRLDNISAFGFKGVLFDECGYRDGVSRDRLTDAVNYAHQKGLSVIANTLYSTGLFDNAYHPTYNPTSKPTPFTNQDGYLFESYVVLNGNYFRFAGENGAPFDDWEFWRAKSDTLNRFQKQIGFKVFSVTTPDAASTYDAAKHRFVWFCAWLWNHEATGWSEYNYSSDVSGNPARNSAPFRTPPAVASPGNQFLTEFSRTGEEHFRFTNTGKVFANTQTKQAGFVPCGTITSNASGPWTNGNTWTVGRAPYPCDAAGVSAIQTISISTPVTARKIILSSQSKLTFGNLGKLLLVGE